MAIYNPNGAAKNDGCTIVYGTVNRVCTNAPGKSIAGNSKVRANYPSNDSDDLQSALSGGVFANQEKGQYIILGVTTRLAGTTITRMKSGNNYLENNHASEKKYNRLIDQWYYTTGQPTGVTVSQVNFGRDDAARVSRSKQGEFLTYTTGKIPASGGGANTARYNTYSKKTG